MIATAILPVKRFAAAKQRLAVLLGADARATLVAAMLDDVLAAIRRAARVERTIVVTGERAAERTARKAGYEVVVDPLDAGHSEAAAIGIERALEHGAECAALLPGDCPLLDPAELDAALARMSPGHVAIVPDRHGTGTNGLLLAPPDAIEASFGPGSRKRHERLVRAGGLDPVLERLGSLALDLDTPDDLAAIQERLQTRPNLAPRTAAALRGHVAA
jgi:2-phospho-L-lactate/phosphoenolpyruvate guanylyltransferase